eukprot:gene13571-28799_t
MGASASVINHGSMTGSFLKGDQLHPSHIFEYIRNRSAVEEFVEEAYLIGAKSDAGLRLIVNNPRARNAFINFLTDEGAEFFKFFEDMDSMSRAVELETVKSIVDQYKTPRKSISHIEVLDNITAYFNSQVSNITPKVDIDDSDHYIGTIEEQDEENEEYNNIDSTYVVSNETFAMMALNIYPKFIGSEAYKKWREEESKEVDAVIATTTTTFGPVQTTSISPDSFASRCFQFINPTAVDRLFGTGSWLTTFVSAAEGLPICVTLADADNSRPGFPLIYVNNVFENATGFSREQIRGRNCKFLQGHASETEIISYLSTSLSNAVPVRAVITNFKKDGTPFKNLLAMKPLFDMQGKYCYVVGVQFDASTPSKHGSSIKMMKLVNKLLEAIPDSIPFGGTI